MIVYRCDVTGKDLDLERAFQCDLAKQQFSKEHPNEAFGVDPQFYWKPEYDELLVEYFIDRANVIAEQRDLMNRTLTNHRKNFFKEARKGQLKAVK